MADTQITHVDVVIDDQIVERVYRVNVKNINDIPEIHRTITLGENYRKPSGRLIVRAGNCVLWWFNKAQWPLENGSEVANKMADQIHTALFKDSVPTNCIKATIYQHVYRIYEAAERNKK